MAALSAVLGARLVALDTAPFIYLVERHPLWFSAVEPVFAAIDAGNLLAVTSALTLLEVLVKPLEVGDRALADDFRALFERGSVRVVDADVVVADVAARLRAQYRFWTPDAIHLGSALVAGADVFLTHDKRLASFPELRVVTL